MSPSMTPEQFIKKWTAANLSERSAPELHFLDLCALLGQPTPAEEAFDARVEASTGEDDLRW